MIRIGPIRMRSKPGFTTSHPRRASDCQRQRSTMGRKIVLRLLLATTIAPLACTPSQLKPRHCARSSPEWAKIAILAPWRRRARRFRRRWPRPSLEASLCADSADYGSVTINQAVSIISGHGATGVSATSKCHPGVTINAGANDVINLQGLDLTEQAPAPMGSVQYRRIVECPKQLNPRFSNGINFQPNGSSALSVGNTLVSNNPPASGFRPRDQHRRIE